MPDDADELDDNETNVKNSTATGKHDCNQTLQYSLLGSAF